ncbi:DUF6053 domain-containing protein [Lysobacter yananisis]|uniref:DUF6053 domain-containing protein n=1 Tax=Lysobacter yananisis TaxID=1003114 RepID=UPI003CE54C48
MGGPSGPTLLFQIAATWDKSVGPEGPPTSAGAPARFRRARPWRAHPRAGRKKRNGPEGPLRPISPGKRPQPPGPIAFPVDQ